MSELIRVFETGVLPIIHEYVMWQIYKDVISEVLVFLFVAGLITAGALLARKMSDDL